MTRSSNYSEGLWQLRKKRLRERANDLDMIIHHGFGNALDSVALRHLNKFRDFDHISRDMLVFDGQLMGQSGRTRTIRAGRRDKDLNVQILRKLCQGLTGLVAQIRSAFRVENS